MAVKGRKKKKKYDIPLISRHYRQCKIWSAKVLKSIKLKAITTSFPVNDISKIKPIQIK